MISALRHYSQFDPATFRGHRIDVVGAGALGSRLTLELARIGVEELHIWDKDRVAAHNLANQAFARRHVGSPKLDALRDLVEDHTGTRIHLHPEFVTGETDLPGTVVCVMPDSLLARRDALEAVHMNLQTELLLEARLGVSQGRVYAFNPNDVPETDAYRRTLEGEVKAATNPCGTTISVGATAEMAVSILVWRFIRWRAVNNGTSTESESDLEHEVVFSLRPVMVMSRRFHP